MSSRDIEESKSAVSSMTKEEFDDLFPSASSVTLAPVAIPVPDVPVADMVESITAKLGTRPDRRIGVPTGFKRFDYRTRGLHNGKVYVVASRPGGGKTSWVTTVLANISRLHNYIPLLMFSTELTQEEVIMQVVEAHAGGVPIYPNNRVSSEDEMSKLKASLNYIAEQVGSGVLNIKYGTKLAVPYMRSTIEKNPGATYPVVFIDQASRIDRDDKGGKRQYSIATEEMINDLETMAQEFDVPIVLVTQLNRTAEFQKNPTLANIKHSGAFEEFAHAVYLLDKDEDHGQTTAGSAWTNHGATCHVAKSRHGQVGPVKFNFYGESHTWLEMPDD